MMKVGLVGMPNAGKSSLFNALSQAGAEAANYPFTTIEPNVATVPVKDQRMEQVAATVKASNIVWDTIEFHDIAGLVAGASKGEGLGNKFLANIRECDALLHVVRCHNDENILHPEGSVDPARDIETIETELLLADLDSAERRHARVVRDARSGDRAAVAEEQWLRQVIEALQAGTPARAVPVPQDAPDAARNLYPLTGKPVLFVANVDEGDDAVPSVVADHAAATGAAAVAISSRIEADLADMEDDEEAAMMREELGIGDSGLHRVVNGAFGLLHLIAFFTAGEDKPAQTWHLREGLTAWHAAGSDPQRHPEGVRPRRGDRLGCAGRRRRVCRGSGQGHTASRRPRLPDEGRRRDHDQAHRMSDYTIMRAGDAPDYTGGKVPSPFLGYARPMGAEQIAFNVRVIAPGALARPAGVRSRGRAQPQHDRGDLLRHRRRARGQARR